jgi:dihydroflavonol-4-reductase
VATLRGDGLRYLVTGATGFIGAAVTRRLARDGHHVTAIVRAGSDRSELTALGARLVEGDVTDSSSLAHAVRDVDVVIHLAALVKARTAREYFRVNAHGTRMLAQACMQAGVSRFIYVSSLAAGGPTVAGSPRREDDVAAPVSDYGRSKLEGEQALRDLTPPLSATVVRPCIVYGPGDREFLWRGLRLISMGVLPKPGLGERRISLLHVDDFVDLLILVVEKGQPLDHGSRGLYYASDSTEYRYADLAVLVGHALGRRPRVVAVPHAAMALAVSVMRLRAAITGRPSMLNPDKLRELKAPAWTCCADRARRELGWQPRVEPHRGFADAARWFAARGLL